MRINKKAVTPVIATVLLIMITIILAAIILLWLNYFTQESVLKQIPGSDKPKKAEFVCQDIKISPFINTDDSFGYTNEGNVPIYATKLKTVTKGSSNIEIFDQGDDGMANPGHTITFKGKEYDSSNQYYIIPVILGKNKDGGLEEFTCSNEIKL